MYDYFLGGKDNFAADRATAAQVLESWGSVRTGVRENRAFLGRVVRYLTAQAGIRQFLDIGTGIPTAGNTHQVAQAIAPESRIVYVDYDPIVLAHARALLTSSPEGSCAYVDADIRGPEEILSAAADVIDFARPVGVVLMAVLQFVPDGDDPYGLVRRLMAGVPAGSYLVLSHPASDIQAAAMAGMATRLNELMAQQVKPRAKAEVTAFFDGLDLVEPGVIRCPEWRPDRSEDAAGKSTMWGGVARKPNSTRS